jgi:phosphatidylglycerol:prolipoprotein diacylglycerol transferase
MLNKNNEKQGSTLQMVVRVFLYVFIFACFVPFFFFAAGRAFDRLLFNPPIMNRPLPQYAGLCLAVMGGIVMLWAMVSLFKIGKGYPLSPLPPVNLVTTGVYKWSRHPIYAGASLVFLGVVLWVGSAWGVLLGWPGFTLFFIAYAQTVEEPILFEKYRGEYPGYSKEVPLLFPYPGRRRIRQWAASWFMLLSRRINRPWILKYKRSYFFAGYAAWWMIGSLPALGFLSFFLLRSGIAPGVVDRFEIFFVLAALLGAHIAWFLEARVETHIKPSSLGAVAGFTSWGALGGAAAVCVLFALGPGPPVSSWLDSIIPMLLVHFFGRLGCSFYGCCYGKPTHSEIHLDYTHPALKAVRENLVDTRRLYPVQFFSALYGLASFTVILLLQIHLSLQRGLPIVIGLFFYSTSRFIEEWYRVPKRLFWGIFSIAQLISVFLAVSMAGLLLFYFPYPGAVFYEPLSNLPVQSIISKLDIPVLIILSAIIAFSFGFHRKEIGRWR